MERVTGIEPVYSAWKAAVLPLYYTRPAASRGSDARAHCHGERFPVNIRLLRGGGGCHIQGMKSRRTP